MERKSPKISVLMPVYNGREFLKEAVQSILEQSFEDFEFVIVDDKSTDDSCEIIESFKDDRIRLIKSEKQGGMSVALNKGLDYCQAPYIARMDADDIATHNRLTVQYDYLQSHPEIDMVGSWMDYINREGRYIRTFKTPTDPDQIKGCMASSGELSRGYMVHSTVLARKEIFEKAGFYREGIEQGYPQDYDLWNRMGQKGVRFANIGQSLLKYRVLPMSESRCFRESYRVFSKEVSKEKIRFFMTELDDGQLNCLANMLEYWPQDSYEDGLKVFDLFDQYYAKYVGESVPRETARELKDRLRYHYLIVLFLTNKRLSMKEYFKMIFRRPGFLFDKLYYRKMINVFLKSVLKKKQYVSFLNKVVYR